MIKAILKTIVTIIILAAVFLMGKYAAQNPDKTLTQVAIDAFHGQVFNLTIIKDFFSQFLK